MKKSKSVIFVDPFGKEHDALVAALNGLNEGYISIIYIDESAPEADNVRRVYDIPHMSQVAEETNPSLPTFHMNCWKDEDEDHNAPPADHPAFDHPFASQIDKMHALLGIQSKPVTPADRPAFYAAVSAHLGATEGGEWTEAEKAEETRRVHVEWEAARAKGDKSVGDLPPGVAFLTKEQAENLRTLLGKVPLSGGPADLKAILNRDENLDVTVKQDGSVTAVPAAPPTLLPAPEPDIATQLDAAPPAPQPEADATGTP